MFTSDEIMEVMQLDGIKHRVVPFHPRHIHMANFRSFEKDLIDGYGRPHIQDYGCLLYTSPSPRDGLLSRMPSSA